MCQVQGRQESVPISSTSAAEGITKAFLASPSRRFPLRPLNLMAKLSLSGRLRRESCVAAVVGALTKPHSLWAPASAHLLPTSYIYRERGGRGWYWGIGVLGGYWWGIESDFDSDSDMALNLPMRCDVDAQTAPARWDAMRQHLPCTCDVMRFPQMTSAQQRRCDAMSISDDCRCC